jgi:hypothetical protein
MVMPAPYQAERFARLVRYSGHLYATDGTRMNKWIRRTAGTVGIAGGALLLGTAAHADNPVIADPQSLHGVTDTASLDGGLSGVGVSVDTPGQRDTVGLLPDGGGPVRSGTNTGELGAVVHAPTKDGQPRDVFANGRTPDIFQALPITDVVPMDGLGMPTSQARTLPARESLPTTGLPVRNLPIGTNMAGDTLRGGDSLARDGFADNGLGVPLGDQLPLGAAQNLASQGQSLGGGSPLGGGSLGGGSPLGGGSLGGGSPLGGLPLVGGSNQGGSAQGGSNQSGRARTTPQATSRDQASPVLAGDAVHVLPPSESGFTGRHRTEAGLPTPGGLPVVGGVLQGGTLPTKANVNTLPGAPALPVHNLLAPGTSAAGASTGNALNQATGTVGNLAQGAGGTESLPIGDEALPVVGGLTSPTGTRGMDLPSTRGIPVIGGVADGLTGKHRAQYTPRHSV